MRGKCLRPILPTSYPSHRRTCTTGEDPARVTRLSEQANRRDSAPTLVSPQAGMAFGCLCWLIYCWLERIYVEEVAVTKRLIDIDDELLASAQEAAGQDSIKGTVTEALNRLVAQQHRREQYLRESWAQLGDALADLEDDDVMRRAWS